MLLRSEVLRERAANGHIVLLRALRRALVNAAGVEPFISRKRKVLM